MRIAARNIDVEAALPLIIVEHIITVFEIAGLLKICHLLSLPVVLLLKGEQMAIHPSDAHFKEVYDLYSNDVFHLALSYIHRTEDAENVTQDVFFSYYANPPKNEEKIKSYLLTLAIRSSLNLLRKNKREADCPPSLENIPTPKETTNERGDELLECLPLIGRKYEEAIRLFYYADMDIDEIASKFHISVSSVKKRLERGRKILKEKIIEAENKKKGQQ